MYDKYKTQNKENLGNIIKDKEEQLARVLDNKIEVSI